MDSYCCYMVWANETWSQCITDTVAWFPSKIPMPTTSSIDYIKAGIANIIHALQFPSPNSPLAPLSDSQSWALQQLMLILHSTTSPNQPTLAPAPPLRVDAPAPLATASPVVAPPIPLTPAPPVFPQVLDSTSFIPTTPVLEPTTPDAPSLRVALPSPHPDDDTIPMDNHTKKLFQPPPTVTLPPRTHSQCQPHHSPHLHAAHAFHCSPRAPADHAAFHGNAFNPDTGELVEYKELSSSTDGSMWKHANATEIHRLA